MAQQNSIAKYTLSDFRIENFKGIKETEIGSLPQEAKWVFLTGENGYGKTSILQALAIGLYGLESHSYQYFETQNEKPPNLSVTLFDNEEDKELSYKAPSKSSKFQRLCCYGSSRLDMAKVDKHEEDSPTISLFRSLSLLRNVELQLSRWYFKQEDPEFKQKFESVRDTLKKVLGIKKIEIDPKTDQVYYFEKDKENRQYEKLPSRDLASGYRSLIGMIGDIIHRLFESQPEVHDLSDLSGIVIIDEIDLHFHPKLQKRLPTLLSEIFPRLFFVASTHSSIPILGAPENSVILTVDRNRDEGIFIERLSQMEKQLSKLTPNILLSSPIFGLQDIFPSTFHGNSYIHTEDSFQDLQLNEAIKNRLKSHRGSDREQDLLELFNGENE